jgi:hypothetical protein
MATEMKKVEMPRTRNREWGFYGTCVTNGHQDPEAAWDEIMSLLTDPRGRFRFTPEVARDLLDAPWGRHLANEVVGTEFGSAVEKLAGDRRWMKSTLEITRAIVRARADSGGEGK